MNWLLVLTHGLKAFAYVIVGAIVAVLLGAIATALGYKPEGILNQFVWTYIVIPVLSGIAGAIDNWYKHRTA